MSVILFVSFIFLFVILPGFASILSIKKIREVDFICFLAFALIWGSIQLILISLLLSVLNLNFHWIYILPFFSVLILYKSGKLKKINVQFGKRRVLITLICIILFSLIQSYPMFKGYKSA